MWGPHYQKLSAVPGRTLHGSLNSHKLTHAVAVGTRVTQVRPVGYETDVQKAAVAWSRRGSGSKKNKPVEQAHHHVWPFQWKVIVICINDNLFWMPLSHSQGWFNISGYQSTIFSYSNWDIYSGSFFFLKCQWSYNWIAEYYFVCLRGGLGCGARHQ